MFRGFVPGASTVPKGERCHDWFVYVLSSLVRATAGRFAGSRKARDVPFRTAQMLQNNTTQQMDQSKATTVGETLEMLASETHGQQ